MNPSDTLEAAFGTFLEDQIYDDAQEVLFQLTRSAYLAGWQAALEQAQNTQTD